jgi:inositol transport system substrate-binding protein
MNVAIRFSCSVLLGALLLGACGAPTTSSTNPTSAANATPASGASGGGQSASSSGKKICFAFQSLETEFWGAGYQAITKALKDKNIQVVERNSGEDRNKQLEQIKDCITQKVDGIIIIPVDGDAVIPMIAEANKANIPIGVFNRPPADSNTNPAIVVVANNEVIAEQTVDYMAQQAKKLNRKVTPLIMVGDLADPNAVGRKKGFDNVIKKYPDLFNTPVEVATKWDAATGLAGLQNAMQANPNVDFIFTSSDFLYPQIKSVLEPLGKWKPIGDPNHVILGGLDGDSTACGLMRDKYVDATGVQNLFFEADAILNALLKAIESGNGKPNERIDDKGFALTQDNMAEKEKEMWGCVVPPPKKG